SFLRVSWEFSKTVCLQAPILPTGPSPARRWRYEILGGQAQQKLARPTTGKSFTFIERAPGGRTLFSLVCPGLRPTLCPSLHPSGGDAGKRAMAGLHLDQALLSFAKLALLNAGAADLEVFEFLHKL